MDCCYTKRFKWVVTFLLAAFLGVFLSGCYLFPKEEPVLAPPLIEPPEITYDVMEVKRGTIEKKITGSGTFVSVEQGNMFFKARGGRIKAIHVKIGDKVKKGDLLAELDTAGLEYEIEQQKLVLRKAQLRYNQIKESGGDKYSLEIAACDVELARLQLKNLQRQLEEAKLRSTMDGTVVYVDNRLGQGDYIDAYSTLVKIADPTKLQLQYSGSNLSDFQVGMKVEVKIRDNVYEGQVVMTPATVPVNADESLKNVVRIDVPNLPEDVTMGDTAQFTLTLDKRENVIVLPRNLVRNYMGRKYVLVLENGLKKERDVEVGLETPTEVEIIKGLEEGEKVIVD
ncbi:RND family efflux transporter MFP subunit [Caldicoprobacter guelmensis]|uniref:efflux RND transporter periplasmic adaptor subunit n=1 Tax=Caldicoprobacter guelmensis TaxID=1170224 RepID=UPI0019560712|nr:efflux RND transporter periplasmic adaptor subunit [Caldicoprobacter guelmensis]MBM7582549.1 RND family efflux transporter MFP subunit [Caldicoprobacter guelmensis]